MSGLASDGSHAEALGARAQARIGDEALDRRGRLSEAIGDLAGGLLQGRVVGGARDLLVDHHAPVLVGHVVGRDRQVEAERQRHGALGQRLFSAHLAHRFLEQRQVCLEPHRGDVA